MIDISFDSIYTDSPVLYQGLVLTSAAILLPSGCEEEIRFPLLLFFFHNWHQASASGPGILMHDVMDSETTFECILACRR